MQSEARAMTDTNTETKRRRLRDIIAEKSLLTGGTITLVSGAESSFYFDMKRTAFDAEGLNLIAELILDELAKSDARFVGGLEMGAVPVVVAVCMASWRGQNVGGFFVRKQTKEHGTKRVVEGIAEGALNGAVAVLVDDVTTTGGSVLKSVEAARAEGATVTKVITVVDRLEGAQKNLAAAGIELVPLLTAKDFAL